MAAKQGYGGNVTWAAGNTNTTTNVYSWNLSIECDELETTDFGSSGEKEFLPGLTEWSGSFNVRLDDTTAMPSIGAATEIELQISGAFGYKGDAFIKSINPVGEVSGLFECTINFRGTGTLTIGAI